MSVFNCKVKMIICIILLISCRLSKASIYSHVYRLRDLFMAEEYIFKLFQSQTSENSTNSDISKYVEMFQTRVNEVPFLENIHHKEAHLDLIMEKLVGNPIHVYCLLTRFYNIFRNILLTLKPDDFIRIKSIISKIELPTDDDIEGSVFSLARVSYVYKIEPLHLAKGIIHGIRTEARLDADQLMDIARRRASGKLVSPVRTDGLPDFRVAIEFAEAAANMVSPDSLKSSEIQTFLSQLRNEHDSHWERIKPAVPNESFFTSSIVGKDQQVKSIQDLKNLENGEGSVFQKDEMEVFNCLCRGERLRFHVKDKDQFCYQKTIFTSGSAHPMGLKIEVLSADPPVLIYHQVLSSPDIRKIQKIAEQRLTVAQIQVNKNGELKNEVSSFRVQTSGWIKEHDEDFLYKLSEKIEAITNLKLRRPDNIYNPEPVESEAYQVGVYSAGGHFLPHYDVMQDGFTNANGVYIGNRIATAMFYLSNLTGGGATAFPKLGIAAFPRAGSMVFWYNLKLSGVQDNLSRHGACPVSLGVKWVSNKWIREAAQIFNRKCGLNPDL